MADAETPTPPAAAAPAPVPAAKPEPAPAPKPAVEVPETYTALVDLQYGEQFVKAGETTNTVPKNSVKWLVEQKFIVKKEVT
jgi:hypothetical protein